MGRVRVSVTGVLVQDNCPRIHLPCTEGSFSLGVTCLVTSNGGLAVDGEREKRTGNFVLQFSI